MIKVSPIKDNNIVKKLFNDKNIEYSETSAVLCAVDENGEIGNCFLKMSQRGVELLFIEYNNSDDSIVDWLIRSAMNYAANRGAYLAYTSITGFENLFRNLSFENKNGEFVGEVPEIFKSCRVCSCKK